MHASPKRSMTKKAPKNYFASSINPSEDVFEGGEIEQIEGGLNFFNGRLKDTFKGRLKDTTLIGKTKSALGFYPSVGDALEALLTGPFRSKVLKYLTDYDVENTTGGAPPVVVQTYWRSATNVRSSRFYIEIAPGLLTPLSKKLVLEIIVNTFYPYSLYTPYYTVAFTIEPVFPVIQEEYIINTGAKKTFGKINDTIMGNYPQPLKDAFTYLSINGVKELERERSQNIVHNSLLYPTPLYTSVCVLQRVLQKPLLVKNIDNTMNGI
jgi:hypothetical protein